MSTLAEQDVGKAEAALEVMRAAGSVSARAQVVALSQMEGGWSRHTYALTIADPEQPERCRYIVRVRPRGSVLDSDIGQEFRTYALLVDEPIPSPGVHGFTASEDTPFDGPFFVMDRLRGHSPNVWRERHRKELAENWARSRSLAEDLVTHMARIHAIPSERLGDAVARRDFRETVAHWRGIYDEMRMVRDPVIEEAYAWVLGHEPEPVAPCLVHGDYRVGNCLLEHGHITGVLDWELSFVGDPRFDLGYMSLEYHAGTFVEPGSPLLNAVADRDWFEARYAAISGRRVDRAVVQTFAGLGALMLYSILITGIRLYARGESPDVRTAWARFVLPGLRRELSGIMGWNPASVSRF